MALIKCTECQKEISDKAKSCPSCGVPNELPIGPFDVLEKSSNFIYNSIGALVILYLGLFGATWYYTRIMPHPIMMLPNAYQGVKELYTVTIDNFLGMSCDRIEGDIIKLSHDKAGNLDGHVIREIVNMSTEKQDPLGIFCIGRATFSDGSSEIIEYFKNYTTSNREEYEVKFKVR